MPDAQAEHQEGRGAHRAERRLRRDRMRGELRGPGHGTRAERRARVLVLDRYDVGERQTSACAAPTGWLEVLGLERSIKQTFDRLVLHTPHRTMRFPLPWTFSTFDYRTLCELLDDQNDAEFETATVEGRASAGRRPGGRPHRPGRGHRAPGRRCAGMAPRARHGRLPAARCALSRGLEVHPGGSGGELEIWIDRSIVPAGYGWSFPAADEVRVGVGSFDPRFHVKDPTVDLAERLQRDAVRYQGNWIPHKLAPRGRRRRLLRRRLRRPLPAADRGGDPHGLLLRDRAGPRAART